MKKTNAGLVDWARKWVGQAYWYGTYGQPCSQSLLDQKAKQYPDHYASNRMARYQQDISNRKSCTDCSGLIRGYYWSDESGKIVRGLDGRPEKSADGLKNAANKTEPIQSLPEKPGLILWKKGHVGIYIGQGYAIEARGFSYGVVKTEVKGRGWQMWFQCPYIDAEDDENMENGNSPDSLDNAASSCARVLRYQELIRGDDVKLAQEILTQRGYNPGAIDGAYGPKTADAVRRFQLDRGLQVDGVVGSETWASLLR